jgi:hypothetical protein
MLAAMWQHLSLMDSILKSESCWFQRWIAELATSIWGFITLTYVMHFVLSSYGLLNCPSQMNKYTIHNFDGDPTSVPVNGIVLGENPAINFGPSVIPPIHGQHIEFKSYDQTVPLPLPGMFDWHYLQCVISRFGTNDYKNFKNVTLFEFPFRTEDEDDDDGFELLQDGIDPPYPSYNFDRFLWKQAERCEKLEQNQSIVGWLDGVDGEGKK